MHMPMSVRLSVPKRFELAIQYILISYLE